MALEGLASGKEHGSCYQHLTARGEGSSSAGDVPVLGFCTPPTMLPPRILPSLGMMLVLLTRNQCTHS